MLPNGSLVPGQSAFVIALAILLAPVAHAVTVDGQAVEVELDESDSACSATDISCRVVQDEDGSISTLDAYMGIAAVRLATNGTFLATATQELVSLPDVDFVFNVEDVNVSYDAVDRLSALFMSLPLPRDDTAGADSGPFATEVYCSCPGLTNHDFHNQSYGMEWGDGLVYDHVSAPEDIRPADLRAQYSGTENLTCALGLVPSDCEGTFEAYRPVWNEAPNVKWGASAHQLEAATYVEDLGSAATSGATTSNSVAMFAPPNTHSEVPVDGGQEIELAATDPHPDGFDFNSRGTTFVPTNVHEQNGKTRSPPVAPPTGGQVVILVAAAATACLVLVLAGLYSRFTSREQIVTSGPRALLLRAIRDSPGLTIEAAASFLNVNRTAAIYHLRMLEKAQAIELVTIERRTFAFALGMAPRNDLDLFVLRNPDARPIVHALRGSGAPMTRSELHALIGNAPERTRNALIQRMEQARVVVSVNGQYSLRPPSVM